MSSPLVLELCDAGLRLSDGDAKLIIESPGVAVQEGRELLVGEAAWQRMRLNPRQAHSAFWPQLDQAPMSRKLGQAQSTADLAFEHLCSLKEAVGDQEVLLAVPGSLDRNRLAVLLGLSQAAGIRACGLVDAAVAAAATIETAPSILYLDIGLENFLVSALDGAQDVLPRSVAVTLSSGLLGVYDAAAAIIADAFVKQSRFDPLHGGQTEQALYAQLPDWLSRDETVLSLELDAAGRTHSARLERAVLHQALQRIWTLPARALASVLSGQDSLLLSHRVAQLPGLRAHLQDELGLSAVALDSTATARGVLMHAERIRSEPPALAHVTRLPRIAAAPGTRRSSQPTHGLHGDLARPLTSFGDAFVSGPGGIELRQAGRPSRRLQPGDEVEVDGQQLRLIVVDDDNGSPPQ